MISEEDMPNELYELHLQVGLKAGIERTCGKKNPYNSFVTAQKAANSHNRWDKRNHDVEPYPCAFCLQWHLGKIMPIDVLKQIRGE